MISFRLLPALITLSLAFPLGTMAQPAPENEAALLQEMLRARYAFEGQENVQILVGQLPESLPDDLPLPEEAQIIGSIIKTGSFETGTDSTEILLRVNQSSEEVYSLYQQQLLDRGWQVEYEAPEINGGFLARDAVNSSQISSSRNSFGSFCSPSQTAHLYIDAAQFQTNSSAVLKLTLNSVYSETQPLSLFECSLGIEYAPLPALTLPANAEFISSGSSFSNNEASSDAVIETDLDAESLINHYANQLQQAGWTQVDTSELGLSRWSFQDEEGRDWHSLLIITEIPGIPDQYASYVRVLRRSEAIAQ